MLSAKHVVVFAVVVGAAFTNAQTEEQKTRKAAVLLFPAWHALKAQH